MEINRVNATRVTYLYVHLFLLVKNYRTTTTPGKDTSLSYNKYRFPVSRRIHRSYTNNPLSQTFHNA